MSGEGENSSVLCEYESKIQGIYGDKKIGYSTDYGMVEGVNKVYDIVDRARRDKRVNLYDFIDFYNYLHENGII